MELDKLTKKLSDDNRDLLNSTVAMAASRGHEAADLEHWLLEVTLNTPKDILSVFTHFDVKVEKLQADVTDIIERFNATNDGFPKVSPDIIRLLFEGWMVASTRYESLIIRPVHILLALLENDALCLRLTKISRELEKIDAADFAEQCEGLLRHNPSTVSDSQLQPSGSTTKTPALDQFAINLTAQARDGKIEKIIGRDDEIRQMIDILTRRKQNNPILTGEAGVGKTAVVEGLAERIARGEVPDILKAVDIYALDLGLLQAGAGVKGEFENRLKNVIKEVGRSVTPIIIFIDEAHTMIGAGNQSGGGDAANLLKPALARGELRTIAATTWAEYKKYFESDAALTRRFQVVKVEEPSEDKAKVMLRSIAPSLEEHHNVVILDEAVSSAVTLSHRYIAGRQLPDKCVSLLDTACARVNLSQSTIPAQLEADQKQIDNIVFEIERLKKEIQDGYDHTEILVELEDKNIAFQASRDDFSERWEKEKKLIKDIVTIRLSIQELKQAESEVDVDVLNNFISSLTQKREELRQAQGQLPLVYECVDSNVIAEVIADWTGIPVGRMQNDEINNILALQDFMGERVIGQGHAINLIAKTMQTARAKLSDPKRPLGVFMLVGPSGVGKTETALALAEQLYGSEQNITVINMSEFKEEHKVSLLMGSPPGYVGYGEGGVLTEAVRRKPYSVVLLDEMEKAHPGVQDIFYQVFDKGILRDGEGRDIDFKNTVIIMTSNTASEQIEQLCVDPDTKPLPEGMLEAIGPTLRETYKPAFLGRINIIPYYPLDETCLAAIARMQLETIRRRIQDNYRIPLTYSEKVIYYVTEQCQQSDTGARRIAALLNNTLLPLIAEKMLVLIAESHELKEVIIDLSDEQKFVIECISECEM